MIIIVLILSMFLLPLLLGPLRPWHRWGPRRFRGARRRW